MATLLSKWGNFLLWKMFYREDDSKGNFATVPWDKTSSCFKFRRNLEKMVVVNVTQISNVELTIERSVAAHLLLKLFFLQLLICIVLTHKGEQ